jgi:hypothetical protein
MPLKEARRRGIAFLGHLQEGVDPAEAARGGFRSIEHLGPGATLWASCSSQEEELKNVDFGPQFNMTLFKIPFMRRLVLRLFQTVLINPAAFARPAHVERLKTAVETYEEHKALSLIASFVSAGTWHVPTLVRLRSSELADLPEYQTSPYLKYMPIDKLKKWRMVTRRFMKLPLEMRETYSMAYPQQLRLAKRLADGGVRMMTGTDGGWLAGPGLTLQEEFGELHKAGIAPLQILQMSTINAAEYLGRTATMGSIAAGHDANMVVLDANPLDNVKNLGRIAGVVRAGFFYSRSELDALTDRVARRRGYL